MTLIDRLRAVIEERLALAEPTTSGPWANTGQDGEGDAWQIHGAPTGETRFEFDADSDEPNGMVEVPVRHQVATLNYSDGGGVWRKEDADHIVANQPSMVTRRCAADLDLLTEHARVWLENQWVEGVDGRHLGSVPVCRTCEPPKQLLGPAWPCRTIVLLAEGYGITEEET